MEKKKEVILAVEASAKIWSLALVVDGIPVNSFVGDDNLPLSRFLGEKVIELLNAVELSLTDLNLIFVCTGPGSFTGIRVSVAFVRGLANALGIKLMGFSLLDLLSEFLDEDRLQLVFVYRPQNKICYGIYGKGIKPLINVSSMEDFQTTFLKENEVCLITNSESAETLKKMEIDLANCKIVPNTVNKAQLLARYGFKHKFKIANLDNLTIHY